MLSELDVLYHVDELNMYLFYHFTIQHVDKLTIYRVDELTN